MKKAKAAHDIGNPTTITVTTADGFDFDFDFIEQKERRLIPINKPSDRPQT
jgi:hypothetical protein